ncbi:MAG TPA: DUF2007 domain-containing protein [Xanthobacteraceae bacterium]|nr:DUF2007 domain-containing protein [Xanthobacteraceae bacterium]
MSRAPDHPRAKVHADWAAVELVRTNDPVALSAITALLTAAHIPFMVADYNLSVLTGSLQAFPIRIIVQDCCGSDARRLLEDAGYGPELASPG